MIIDQLLLLGLSHGTEPVVFTLQLPIESLERLQNVTLNLSSLLRSVETWAKWISSKISSYSNSGTDNHLCFFWWEIWCIQFHFGILSNVPISLFVSMVSFDYLIEQVREFLVRLVATSIHTNSRICVLASRENRFLESEIAFVFLELVFVPYVSCQQFAQQ